MRRLLIATTTALLVLGVAGIAGAKTLSWHGTIITKLAANAGLKILGSGVATVNNSTNNSLNTLAIPGTNTGSGIIPITDPDVTVIIKSIRISAGTRPATFADFKNPPLSLNQGAIYGSSRICLIVPGCSIAFILPHSQNSGATAIGVGGLLTAGGGKYRFSLYGQPWTIGTVTAVNQTVLSGSFTTFSAMGYVHGPASLTSSAAQPSGVVQLVSPTQIQTAGNTGNIDTLSLFNISIIHFIPEPGYLLLLGAGAAGLVALGRKRLRK